MKDRAPQAIAPAAQHPQRALDPAQKLRQLLNVGSRQLEPMERLAELRAFPSAEAARKFIHRHRVPFLKRGRRVLVDLRDFDRACAAGASLSRTA